MRQEPIVGPPVPEWLSRWIPGISPEFQVQFLDAKGEIFWESNVGPQTWVLLCPASEIMAGGSRGGSKSEALMAWMAMGDSHLAPDDPAHNSYLNDPSFRGLILRKHYDDMAEFIDRCAAFYKYFGGKPKDNPVVFEFKSGAKIYTNHLRDEEAFNKYRGWGITKIGIEEGTQIEKLKSYMALFGSRRSVARVRNHKVLPKLRTQLLMTTNPDGPGAVWIKPRFVEARSGGQLVPWNTPMTDPITKLTRIFIPMRLKDNPYLAHDPVYQGMLLSQDTVRRKQWIDGDWNAGIGPFFTEYRPQGPLDNEVTDMPWARHLIEKADLKPWWYRWGSGDWGYDHPAAFHKYCRNERDKRIHIYDELVVRHMGSYELGVRLANWWLPELEALPDHQITIYLSPDAFSKTDSSKTKAEQIGAGIQEIIGPYGALVLRFNEDERAAAARDPKAAAALFERRRAEVDGKMCIILKAANNNVSDGCSYMRDLLRFHPVRSATEEEIKKHLESVYAMSGVEAYEQQLAAHRESAPEILPKLQIWERCKGLDRCIRVAQRDEAPKNEQYQKWDFDEDDDLGGDDELDSCFIAGTMIQTESGPRPIESVSVGDLVYTRAGLRPVLASGETSRNAQIFTVWLSNGLRLTGTGNHPIFANREFKRLDSLRYGDILSAWAQNPSFSTESYTADTLDQDIGISGYISGAAGTIGSVAYHASIGTSGSTTMVQSLPDATSTTETKIHSTTIPATSNASKRASTTEIMDSAKTGAGISARSSLSGWRRLKRGTLQRQAGSGTPKTERSVSLRGLWSRLYALFAGRRQNPNGLSLFSVQTPANPQVGENLAWMISKRPAECVDRPSNQTNTKIPGSVPVFVVAVTRGFKSPVYNLAVAQNPEYYANGVLVHNCRYGLIAYKEIETTVPRSYWVNERIAQYQNQQIQDFGEEISDPTRLAMIAQHQQALYNKNIKPAGGGSFTFARAGSTLHRSIQ